MAAGSTLYVIIELLAVAAKTRRPDLLAYLLLVRSYDPETRGDPESALLWTTKSTTHLAD